MKFQKKNMQCGVCIHTRVILPQLSQFCNPLYTNGLCCLVGYSKLGIVHYTYLGVSGYNFQKILYFLSEDLFYLNNSVVPDEMTHYAEFHLGLHCL